MSSRPRSDEQRQLPCDQCHKRKVKCGGGLPCNRCVDSDLQCSRNIVRKKRGPKKGHGAVISRLRAESNTSQPREPGVLPAIPVSVAGVIEQTPTSIAVSSLLNEPTSAASFAPIPLSADHFVTLNEFAQQVLQTDNLFGPQTTYFALPTDSSTAGYGSPMPSSTGSSGIGSFPPKVESPIDFGSPFMEGNLSSPGFWSGISSIEDHSLLQRCVDLFFANLYPVYPVIYEPEFRARLQNLPELPIIDRVLVLALCAVTVIHVNGWPDLSHESRTVLGKRLVQQAVTLRATCEFSESSSLSGVLAALFLQSSYFELRRRRSSWFYLREAITLAQGARLHEAAGYEGLTPIEATCARRTYCLLFITERGGSILNVLPVSIKYVPQLPIDILPGESPDILTGIQSLHSLFSLLDERFVELWNAPPELFPNNVQQINIELLQDRLRAIQLDATPLTAVQRADIRITQQWLKLIFWQAAMRQGLISSASHDPAFTYDFPREIGRSLVEILKTLPQAAIQVHGLGIFEKQFEVAYSLLDNLTLSPSRSPEDYENLRYLFQCLSASPSSRDTYVRALETKMDSQRRGSNPAGVEFIVNWDLKQEGRRLSVI